VLGLVATLAVSMVGGWSYVHSVPPFHPKLAPPPDPNGYTRAAAIVVQMHRSYRQPKVDGWPYTAPEPLAAQLRPVRASLDAVRGTFRLEWQTPSDMMNPVPTAYRSDVSSGMYDCARWFVAESVLAHCRGHADSALQRSLDAIELGCHSWKGGGLSEWVTADECATMGFAQAERVAPHLPASAILNALDRLRSLRNRWPPLSDMLETARMNTLAFMTSVLRSDEDWGFILTGPKLTQWQRFRLAWTPRRSLLANIDRYYQQLIAESKKPVRTQIVPPVPTDPWSLAIGNLVSPNNSWGWRGTETELALLEVALAVRMHFLTHDRYPSRLEEISTRWLPAVPRDLWDQPIAYRLRNGQPVVYSLGPDGRDDGGRAIDPTRLTPNARGDLVFGKLSSSRWRR
jgi:hypothetical protein